MSIQQNNKKMHKSLSTTALEPEHIKFTPYSFPDTSLTRTTNLKVPNMNGHAAEVLYKRRIQVPQNYNLSLKDSGYIVDGGINQKYVKLIKPKLSTKKLSQSFSQKNIKASDSSSLYNPNKTETHKVLKSQKSAGNLLKSSSISSGIISSVIQDKQATKTAQIPKPKKINNYFSSSKNSSRLSNLNNIKKNKNNSINVGGNNANNSTFYNSKKWNNSTKIEKTGDNSKKRRKMMRSYSQGELLGSSLTNKFANKEELKNAQIEYLVDSAVTSYIKGLQKNEDKDKSKEKFYKKQKVLEQNNQDSLELESAVTDLSHNSYEEAENYKGNLDKNNSIKKMSKSQKMQATCNKRRKEESNFMTISTTNKKVLKCRVDQFEYLKQIQKHQKVKHNNYIIGDSFRQTTSPGKDKSIQNNNSLIDPKEQQVNANKNKQIELRKYMKKKRCEDKRKQEDKEFEKNKELLQLYGKIYPLNKGNIGNFENIYKTNIKPKSINNIDKDKETYRNTESTVIGIDEFYYSTCLCQQLIGMNEKDILNLKIQESESQTNQNKVDNINSFDKLTSYQSEGIPNLGASLSNKRREQKIVGIIPGTKTETHEKIEGLKNKVDQTLHKAEDIYKKEEIEELIKSSSNQKGKKKEAKKTLNDFNQKQSTNHKKDRSLLKDSLEMLKEIQNIKNENIEQQRKSPKIGEDYKTTNEQVLGTKEKNLPSLSHSFNNTNPNHQIKIEMEPRCVLNLVEIVKLIIQRRTLGTLYEIFIKEMLCQRFTIGFAYFIAVIKQYPYRKLEKYITYKTYYKAFKTLFIPFIRRNFYYFIMKIESNQKIEYLVALITKCIKLKTLEKIYIYGMVRQSQLEGETFMDILTKIVKHVSKPSLIVHFHYFVNASEKLKKKHNQVIEQVQKKDRNIHNHEIKEPSLHISNESKSLERLMIITGEYEEEDNLKMNTYVYESIINTSKDTSSYILECNSTESPKLRKLFQKFLAKNEGEFNVDNIKQKLKRRINPFQINNISKRPNSNEEQIGMFIKKKYKQNEDHSHLLNESDLSNKSFKSFNGISNNKLKLDLSIFSNSIVTDKPIIINTEHNRGRKINKKSLKFSSFISNKNPTSSNKKLQIQTNIFNNNDIHNIVQPKINELKSEKDRIFLPSSPSKKHEINQSISSPKKYEKIAKESFSPIDSKGNLIKKKKYLEIYTDQDYSVDKESNTDIDWQYCISTSKILGKELTDNTNIVNKKDATLSEESNKISPTNKQIEQKYIEDDKVCSVSSEENGKIKNKEKLIDEILNENNESQREETNDKKDDSYGDDFERGNYSSKGSFDNMDNIIGTIRNEINQEQQKQNINDKSRNTPHTISSKLSEQDKSKAIIEENNKFVQEQHIFNRKDLFSKINKDELTKELIKDIIESLLKSEVTNLKKLIPSKPLTYKDNGGNNSVNPSISLSRSGSLCNSNPEIKTSPTNSCKSEKKEISALPQISTGTGTQNFINPVLADSLNFTPFTYSSIFNKTVKEKKKEQSTQLYNTKIGPELIKLIKNVIISKYQLIYENISSPYQNIPDGLMTSLSLQDPDLLRINYRVPPSKVEIAEILDKPKILNEFIPINKQIRLNENFMSEENSDAMLNNCLVDSAIELINKERIYGDQGNPLPWSNRTREIKFKYEKTNPHKLANFIEKELLKLLNNKIGMITENFDYMNIDQINMERERKLIEMIKYELKENENLWNNLEMEETQLKVELTELILEQLYNEVIEILEHIECSRKKPDLYQHKSIFACEEIPKLTFQVTGTEEQEEDNDWTRM